LATSAVRIYEVLWYVKSPYSSGSNFSCSSLSQSGCVKSPVPRSEMPLTRAHFERFSKSISLLVAREYFEWI